MIENGRRAIENGRRAIEAAKSGDQGLAISLGQLFWLDAEVLHGEYKAKVLADRLWNAICKW